MEGLRAGRRIIGEVAGLKDNFFRLDKIQFLKNERQTDVYEPDGGLNCQMY